jgi:putative spermidine/putrescine transport system substrate-binding protein
MTNTIHRRRLLQASAGAAGIAALGFPTLALGQQGKLVINTYGGRWEKFWRENLLPRFTKSTGVDPTLDIGLGRNFVANIRAAGVANPPYGVVMINENIAAQVRAEGFFEPIPADKVPNLANVYPNLKNANNDGVRGIVSAIGLGYRTDLVKTPPKSWKDLWTNPEFKGKIGLYQIGNTAAELSLLMAAKIFGGSEDALDVGFAKTKELMPFQQVDFSSTLATLLTRGDVTVAVIDFPEIVALKKKGVKVDMVIPQEGVVAFEQSFNVLKNAPNKDAAYKYINFILEPEVQQMMAQEFFTSPSNTQVKLPADLAADVPVSGDKMATLNQFDWIKMAGKRADLVDRWNREMK